MTHVETGPGLDPDLWEDSADKFADPPDLTLGFLSADELIALPAPDWVIEDLAPAGGVVVIAGEPESGKTFLAVSLASAISGGSTWMGRGTKLGSVAYASFEASALNLRLQALRQEGLSVENVYIMRAKDPISPRVGRDGFEAPSLGEGVLTQALLRLGEDLKKAGRPPLGALVVDTVRQSLSGSEDSSENVSAYLRSIHRIQAAALPSGVSFLLHHAGWQDGEQQRKRERGSSAFRGNVDTTLYLEAQPTEGHGDVRLVLRVLKLRDCDRRTPIRLLRRKVDLPMIDRFGNPGSSCVIVADPRSYQEALAQDEATAQAKTQAEDQVLDLRVLKVIRDQPVTSLAVIRAFVGRKQPLVDASVARLLSQGLALRGGRGLPYTLTDAGEEALA